MRRPTSSRRPDRTALVALLLGAACSPPEVPTTAAPKPEGEVTLVGYRGVIQDGDAVRYVFDPGRVPRVRMTSRVTASAVKTDLHPHLIGMRIEHHGTHHFQRWPRWARRLRGEGTITLLVEEFQLGHWPVRLTDSPARPLHRRLGERAATSQAVQQVLTPLLAESDDPWVRGWRAYEGAQAYLRVGTATAAEALLAAEIPKAEAAAPGTLPAALYRLRARAADDPEARAAHLEASAARRPEADRQEALRWQAEAADGEAARLEIADEMASIGAFDDAARLRVRVARAEADAGRVEAARAALDGAPTAYASKRVRALVAAQRASLAR